MGTIRPLSPTPHKKFQPIRDQEVIAVCFCLLRLQFLGPAFFWVLQMEMADRLLNVENDLARFHSHPGRSNHIQMTKVYTPEYNRHTNLETAPPKKGRSRQLDLTIPPIDIWHMVRLGTNLLSMKRSLQKFHVLMASGLLSFAAARI